MSLKPRNVNSRFGKVTAQAIAVGVATIVGGAMTVPQMMTSVETKRHTPAVSKSTPNQSTNHLSTIQEIGRQQAEGMADSLVGSGMPGESNGQSSAVASAEPSEEVQYSALPSVDRIASLPTLAPAIPSANPTSTTSLGSPTIASLPSKKTVNEKQPDSIQVFFATDRALVRAGDAHLWIKTIVPSGLAIAICAILLIQAMYAQTRRWVWWTVFAGCTIVTCFMAQQASVQAGQLYRMASRGSVWFSSQRYASEPDSYPLHLGVSEVSLPKNRKPGELPAPSIFKLEFSENADRHVTIQRVDRMSPDEFFGGIDGVLERDDSESALVFIHGYNVTFDDAMRRTAQISADVKFAGASILYSWPSQGKTLSYSTDESNVAWSITHLETFLLDLRQRTGVKKVHVVAHSMGNRVLVGALERLALRFPDKQPMFGQVVMAAPDVDTDEFVKRYVSSVSKTATRATLYASSGDRALLASMKLHGYRRLGLTSSPQPTFAGIDVVDVSPIDTSILGHSYYGSHPLMLQELRELIYSGTGPVDRQWLMTAQGSHSPPLWRFRLQELTAQTPMSTTR
jgi:esterase/lipase superfamily enzyme